MADFKLPKEYEGTVVVDFDGTICEWNHPPKTGNLIPGVKEVLRKLKDNGYTIIINSCRTNKEWMGKECGKEVLEREIKTIKDFLDTHGIHYDRIDDGHNGKIIADYYIDDRNIEFNMERGWEEVLRKISEREGKEL